MITKNPMQLKAIIKKKAIEKGISHQLVLQNYMLERLLERISNTKYRNNFIIKGGFLIGAIVGLETRTTMDLDTTLKGMELNRQIMEEAFSQICDVKIDDDVTFEVTNGMDLKLKEKFFEFIEHIHPDKIILFITHDFSNIDWFHEVLFIHGSKVLAGNHAHLINENSNYRKMFTK